MDWLLIMATEKTPKEMMKAYVDSQKFSSTTEIMDAIHYKVKENHQYQTKAAYVVLGVTMDGTKDILGVWLGEHESSKFWLNVLNGLKSRGVLEVYLFCVDGLNGFVEAGRFILTARCSGALSIRSAPPPALSAIRT